MTIAERLRQQGRIEGLMEVWMEEWMKGIKEGEQIARLKIAQAMFKKGVDPIIIMETTGLTQQELAKIKH